MSVETIFDGLKAVKYPLDDSREIMEVLTKIELKSAALKDEKKQADKLIEELQAALEVSAQEEQELNQQLKDLDKEIGDKKALNDFVAGMAYPRGVVVGDRTVMADLKLTRQQENEQIEVLNKEIELLKQEEKALEDLWHQRVKKYESTLSVILDFCESMEDFSHNRRLSTVASHGDISDNEASGSPGHETSERETAELENGEQTAHQPPIQPEHAKNEAAENENPSQAQESDMEIE